MKPRYSDDGGKTWRDIETGELVDYTPPADVTPATKFYIGWPTDAGTLDEEECRRT